MRSEELEVCGSFVIDQQHASSFALTSLRAADRIFGCEGTADAVESAILSAVSAAFDAEGVLS